MAVTAPFQFARIPRAVWFPDWGKWVSHDIPFADGCSGTIDIEIEAMTPLLIGGERRGAEPKREGEVWPVQLPDGRYAIPGSSLQGMIRNILEIACFGKLGPWVEKRRFGIRDISGSATGTAAYGSRMTGKVSGVITPKSQSGWLQKSAGGKIAITPCNHARIDAANIGALANGAAAPDLMAQLTAATNAEQRYNAFLNTPRGAVPNKARLRVHIDVQAPTNAAHSCGQIWYTHCTAASRPAIGSQAGQLVFTGKPSAGDGANRKHFEFVFYDKPDAVPIAVNSDVWRDFELIHSPPKGSGQKENPNWAYWKADFDRGDPVPIFYIEEVDEATGALKTDTVAAMGTAFMFKLAHTLDTHQMLGNSDDMHRNHEDFDLPSLIFGGIGDDTEKTAFDRSLKRRASFEWAEATLPSGKTGPDPPQKTVLLSPKPSYYPIYVRQPAAVGGLYASYTPVKRRANNAGDTVEVALARYHPELSGAKVWPSPGDHSVKMDGLPPGAGNNVDVTLNALPDGTKFKTTLHVHNLRQVELGALLWALTLGDNAALIGGKSEKRHRVGMGKPFGLGSVAMKVTKSKLVANINGDSIDTVMIMDAFVKQMDALLPTLGSASDPQREWNWVGADQPAEMKWSGTLQVKELIEAGRPDTSHKTDYMPLKGDYGYTQRRLAGEGPLPLVSSGWELSRTENAAVVPLEASPAQADGNPNNREGRHNQARQEPQPARTFRAEKGCPVRHNDDGRTGEISKIEFGLCHVLTKTGEIEPWPTNTFIVTGPPEL